MTPSRLLVMRPRLNAVDFIDPETGKRRFTVSFPPDVTEEEIACFKSHMTRIATPERPD